jgi:hypothetical protein
MMDTDTFDIRVTGASTIGAGRDILQSGLHDWGCCNAADVALVFSELATNAMVHTAIASRTVVTHLPPNVRIAVHDSSHVLPRPLHDATQGGFGLLIVSQLSDSWGWDQTASGKVVWSLIPCGH